MKRARTAFIVVALSLLVPYTADRILDYFDPLGLKYYGAASTYFQNMTHDPDFSYIHRAGYEAELQDVGVKINRHGLRTPEFELEKAAGAKRLIVLGDSWVFGWGVPQDEILSAQLQAILREPHPQWEVIGAGVGSWNTRTEYAWLRKVGMSYSPDAIVLVAVHNDLEPHLAAKTDVPKERFAPDPRARSIWVRGKNKVWKFLVAHTYTCTLLQSKIKAKEYVENQRAAFAEGSPAREDAQLALYGIIELLREKNVPLFIFLGGSEHGGEMDQTFLKLYRAMLDERGVAHYEFPKELYGAEYANSTTDTHRNGKAQKIMADELYRVLASILSAGAAH